MWLKPLSALFFGFAVLPGCLPEDQQAVSKPVSSERQACEAKGGRYEVGGRAQTLICFTPLPDAGEACETATDCAGFCLSETKQCSSVTPQFGCIPHLDETGREQVICID